MAALFNRYGIYAGRIGNLLVRQLGMAEFRSATTKSEPIPGGNVDRSAVITAFGDPMVTLRTPDFSILQGSNKIDLLVGQITDTGAGSPTTSTILQMQQRADGGLFTGGSSNQVLTSLKGWCGIDEISASQDDAGGAMISLNYWCLSPDGIVDPVIWTVNQALTSSPAYNGFWYLGPLYVGVIGGTPTLIKSVQSISIRPGLEYVVKRGDGQPWAAVGSIVSRKPEIRITVADAGEVYAALSSALFGLNITSAIAINQYFQLGLHGGNRVALGTTGHYRITGTTGDSTVETISVQDNGDAGMDLIFRPTGSLAIAGPTTIPA